MIDMLPRKPISFDTLKSVDDIRATGDGDSLCLVGPSSASQYVMAYKNKAGDAIFTVYNDDGGVLNILEHWFFTTFVQEGDEGYDELYAAWNA